MDCGGTIPIQNVEIVTVSWLSVETVKDSPGGCSPLSGSGYAQVAPRPRFRQL